MFRKYPIHCMLMWAYFMYALYLISMCFKLSSVIISPLSYHLVPSYGCWYYLLVVDETQNKSYLIFGVHALLYPYKWIANMKTYSIKIPWIFNALFVLDICTRATYLHGGQCVHYTMKISVLIDIDTGRLFFCFSQKNKILNRNR